MILFILIGVLLASGTAIEALNVVSYYDLFCNCKPGSSPPVCVTYGETWDNYCGNLEYCLKLAKREKLHDGPCNQRVALSRRSNLIIGTCTCAPGSSPPVCVSSHETWDSYCNNLDVCMAQKNVYKLHDGSCVIKDINKVKGLKGPCAVTPGSFPDVCVRSSEGPRTWSSYYPSLDYCLELYETYKLYDGPCFEDTQKVALSRRSNLIIGTCTCAPGSSPPVCVSSHETWDSYCNNLDVCMALKNVYKLHDGPCVIKNITEVTGLDGPCAVTPGSFPDVCVSTSEGPRTWSSYYPSLDYCLELYETYKLYDGPCFEDTQKVALSRRSNLIIGTCTCAPGSSPPVCVSSHETWDSYCNNLDVCMAQKNVYKLHDGPCVIKDINKVKGLKGPCAVTPGSFPDVCVRSSEGPRTWSSYYPSLDYCLELYETYKLYDGPCFEDTQKVALSRRSNLIIGTCTCAPGSSPPVCVSNHETWDSYCNNLDVCMALKNVYKLHDGPCVIKNITEVTGLDGPCAVTPGSFPDVCVSTAEGPRTWSSYYPSLDYCLELYETYKLYDGPCLEDN